MKKKKNKEKNIFRKQEMGKTGKRSRLVWSLTQHSKTRRVSFRLHKHHISGNQTHQSNPNISLFVPNSVANVYWCWQWPARIILLAYIPLLGIQWCTKVTNGFARLIFWIVLRSLMDLVPSIKRERFFSNNKSQFCKLISIIWTWPGLLTAVEKRENKQMKGKLLPKLLKTI